MKKKYFIIGILSLLFIASFFFKIIPIPVENISGNLDKEHFIFGGIYWTSGLQEIIFNNWIGSSAYLFSFVVLIGGIKLWE